MTALITGASGGIGEALARIFAAQKHDLVLVARTEDKLQSLSAELSRAHGIQSRVLAADLTDPTAPPRLFQAIQDQGVTIDALVNNAGFGKRGAYAEIDYEIEARMIQLNVTTLAHLTRLFLPGMLERRSGKILNVASTAAFVPGPFMAVYYASKAFVLSFSEALAEEARDTGVHVSCLCPGATKSQFRARAGTGATRFGQTAAVMESMPVAQAGYKGFRENQRAVI